MDIKYKLSEWKKKTITDSELKSMFKINSDKDLYDLITYAVEKEILKPVKSSGTNGNRLYPFYLKYTIITTIDYSKTLEEISLLNPSIIKNGYLKTKPKFYIKYKDKIKKLSLYLFNSSSKIDLSKKEKSFEIFGEEKVLDDSAFLNFLSKLGLSADILHYYETPEYCFNDYIPIRKDYMTLLICENKDIWFNIRRRMFEDGATTIFNTKIDGIIYGCGNKISEKNALSEYTHFMGKTDVKYLYWGDIDRAGLNIYLSLKKNNPKLKIEIFIPAYESMILLSKNRQIPDSLDNRELVVNYDEIYNLFSDDIKTHLKKSIEDNKRIPQEIINYLILLENMR